MTTNGQGVENVADAIQLLSEPKSVHVLMAQAWQPFADKNKWKVQSQSARRGNSEEMGMADLCQELAVACNTLAHLRKNQGQYKLQWRDNWQKGKQWQDQSGPDP